VNDTDDLASPGRIACLSQQVGFYRVIYCDPPWRYTDYSCQGAAALRYATMSTDQMREKIPITTLAHPDGCFLWMWATWPKIREGAPHDLIAFWGFRWVGEIVWNKVSLGIGRWMRPQTEVLILSVRGNVRLKRNDQRGIIERRRTRHSVKPEDARHIIERLCDGPYIELFARRAARGWDRWGQEAQ